MFNICTVTISPITSDTVDEMTSPQPPSDVTLCSDVTLANDVTLPANGVPPCQLVQPCNGPRIQQSTSPPITISNVNYRDFHVINSSFTFHTCAIGTACLIYTVNLRESFIQVYLEVGFQTLCLNNAMSSC